jgi:hypothetical protein
MAAFIEPPCERPAGVTGSNAYSLLRAPWRGGGAKVAANRHSTCPTCPGSIAPARRVRRRATLTPHPLRIMAPERGGRTREGGNLTGILIAVVVLVGIVAGADLLLSFAVVRRLAALESKIQGGGGQTSPAVGHQVGDFEVDLLTGGTFTLANLMDTSSIVIFLTTTCEPCQTAIAELRELPTPLPFPMYVLINGTDQDGAVLNVAAGMPQGTRVAEISATHPVMRAFGVDGWPSVLGIEDGIVRASDTRVSRVLETANR